MDADAVTLVTELETTALTAIEIVVLTVGVETLAALRVTVPAFRPALYCVPVIEPPPEMMLQETAGLKEPFPVS